MKSFAITTRSREELVDITPHVRKIVSESRAAEGICVVFVPHTTAGITINENADPSVKKDIIKGLGVIPQGGYAHTEGNSPAHIKSSIIGQSLTIPIEKGDLALGAWQGILFAEFDGPRERSVWVRVIT